MKVSGQQALRKKCPVNRDIHRATQRNFSVGSSTSCEIPIVVLIVIEHQYFALGKTKEFHDQTAQ